MTPFKYIISLGTTCQAAYQLERKGLRTFSGPLDWFIIPIASTIKLFNNRFEAFMQMENLEITDLYQNKNLVIKDKLYNVISYHNFSFSGERKINHQEYQKFIDTSKRRIENFYQKIKEPEPILFAIHGDQPDVSIYQKLFDTIKNKVKNDDPFSILVCGQSVPSPEQRTGNIYFHRYKRIFRVKNAEDVWKGSDPEWDESLSKII